MPKRGHQPRGHTGEPPVVVLPDIFLVSLSTASVAQGGSITVTAQRATSAGVPVAQAGTVATWGKAGSGGSFGAATSTTNAAGVATVRFTAGGVVGTTYTFTANATGGVTGSSTALTVTTDLVPASIAITPTSTGLAIGATQQMAAVIKNAAGTVLSGPVVWASATPAAATISAAGLITAIASGTSSITASLLGVTSNAVVATVAFDVVPASLAIAPGTLTLDSGQTASLTSAVKNAAGAVIPGLVASAFQSSDPTKATVDSSGVVRYVAEGSTNITATRGLLTSNTCVVTTNAGAGGGTMQVVTTVDLPSTTLSTALSDTPTGGSTIHVASGGNLQAALDAAVPGDTITLEAGATWTGNYTINPRGGGISGRWIIVKTDGTLPAEGVRMTAARVVTYNLPRISSTSGAAASIEATAAASKFRFIGIAITPNASVTSQNTIVNLGGANTMLADFPSDFIFDRCYIAGHDALECRRGFTLNSYRTAIIDGSIAGIHSTGFDSQAIEGWNGPGVYKIENNYLEASTEVINFGGADPVYVGHNPSDIVIRRNHITRLMAWKGGPYLIKNMLEFKCGVRIDIDSNVIENSWPAAQLGWVGVMWSVNQNTTNPTVETAHVTWRNNVIRNCAAGFQITDGYHGGSGELVAGRDFVAAHHIAIYNNAFIGNDNPAIDDASGALGFYVGTKVDHVSFEHNTFCWPSSATTSMELITAAGTVCADLRIRNNVMGGGSYPMFMLSGNTWASITSGASSFEGNVFGFTNSAYFAGIFGMPAGNHYVETADALGLAGGGSAATSVLASLSDLAISGTYNNTATDGTDPGCDPSAIATAVSGVGGGF